MCQCCPACCPCYAGGPAQGPAALSSAREAGFLRRHSASSEGSFAIYLPRCQRPSPPSIPGVLFISRFTFTLTTGPFQCFPMTSPGRSPKLGIPQHAATCRFYYCNGYEVAERPPEPLWRWVSCGQGSGAHPAAPSRPHLSRER